ncbi:Succinyl-CoA synthetase, alpha subunit [Methylobacterium sp. 174MFSha1.1]|uniref:CoA-binding protein n=1 Tax=Methylobacterium sp. 174MFSha1.1 TaxID=1502749 RepID=UPI0008F05448|nr:CoA-binding protein [Methylobacterium sp. 174MFSha1.1]SFU62080.1 Succinyl-CoA synthetase, alpha subunit [Methylobacterium sp. 174MFSha1.1]
MHKPGIGSFKYYVGISSLDQVATREDRVCVLNILGGESSDVTPVGHAYSGGNVVFGTSPGRRGQVLETPLGNIPVYNNVREGLEAGHRFNCGVVYLPPSGARDGVAELIRVNPELRKIFIVTEKLSVHDSREIRALGQQNGIDIFGGNSLGVADAHHQVRIGGALGGDGPGEALKAGSIAIFSNSGNFTTTIATYLRMSGWGTTTLISCGKDVYIQYAAPEFAFALANDARSKAAVLYVEPGGYYEQDAHFTKPVVACVVGRWKSRLTRAVGHAGAMAGGDDDAAAKERWFMDKFGVDGVFTPENPVVSAKGAVVTNIAHIPAALTAVMRENGARPDFAPESNLALKPWFGSNAGLTLPPELDLPPVEAMAPYGEQIARLNRQVGVVLPRQAMKDASGASQMDPKTQVTSLNGVSMLEAARLPMESNVVLALLREQASGNDRALVNAAIAAGVNLHGRPELAAAEASREAGNSPNVVLAAAASLVGPRRAEAARRICRLLTDRFAEAGLPNALDEGFDLAKVAADAELAGLLVGAKPDPQAEALLAGLDARGARSVFVRYLRGLDGHPTREAVLAAIATTLTWGPLMRKRISRLTAESLPWWLQLFGTLLGAAVPADLHTADGFCGVAQADLLGHLSLGEIGCLALLGRAGSADDVFVFETLIGLLLSNGPGTISAQGCKGAVSADGPESPERVQLNKAMIGFLTHAGYTHGGNGYEGIAFLIEQFRGANLADPADPDHGVDLKAIAERTVAEYARYKSDRKNAGSLDIQKIPGVNHPVFKDKAVNHDPREVWIHDLLTERGDYNAFHAYYRVLVQALFDAGVSRNVYCVNIDAVIAALLLKMLWQPYRSGTLSGSALETAAFTIFLFARMLGCAAEVDDHMNRGRNMDTRTAASRCQFVA